MVATEENEPLNEGDRVLIRNTLFMNGRVGYILAVADLTTEKRFNVAVDMNGVWVHFICSDHHLIRAPFQDFQDEVTISEL